MNLVAGRFHTWYEETPYLSSRWLWLKYFIKAIHFLLSGRAVPFLIFQCQMFAITKQVPMAVRPLQFQLANLSMFSRIRWKYLSFRWCAHPRLNQPQENGHYYLQSNHLLCFPYSKLWKMSSRPFLNLFHLCLEHLLFVFRWLSLKVRLHSPCNETLVKNFLIFLLQFHKLLASNKRNVEECKAVVRLSVIQLPITKSLSNTIS